MKPKDTTQEYDPAEHSLSDRLDRIDATLKRLENMLVKLTNDWTDE